MNSQKPYVVAVGLNDIDEYYQCVNGELQVGDKCFIRFLEAIPGGMIANAACVLAKAGIPTYMLDTLGEDAYTPVILHDMENYGVCMDYVEKLKGYKNCRTEIILTEKERTILIYTNDKPFITINGSNMELLQNASYIYSLMTDLGKIPNYRQLIENLCARGVRLMLDAESTTFTNCSNERDQFFFDRASILSFNEFSLEKFCGGRDPERAIRQLIGDSDKIVITTLGAAGCRVWTADRMIRRPAYAVEPVDTTGAGDTFNASFLAGHMKGWPLEETVDYATAAAARAILHKGAKSGAVDERTVRNFIRDNHRK